MATLTVEQALDRARGLHQRGQLAEAEAIYRQILAVLPQHADALHLLGIIATATGHYPEALSLIESAIAQSPEVAVYHSNLGETYRCLGRLDEAIACFRRALSIQEDFHDCHFSLGKALTLSGKFEEAIGSYRRALELRPDFPDTLLNLGAALSRAGRLDEAIANYQRALSIRPDFAEACNNLGSAYSDMSAWAKAAEFFRRAVAIKPDYAEAQNNLGQALSESGRVEEAVTLLRRVLILRPDYAEAHFNLGYALTKADEWEEAEQCFRRACQIQPDYLRALHNLGNALLYRGRFDEALVYCQRVLALDPGLPEAHVSLGWFQMYLQRYREGWQELEWRLRCPPLFGHRGLSIADQWGGGASAAGQMLLLYAEQGYGDTIQFLRFVPFVRESAGAARVILECPAPLARLVRLSGGWNADVVSHVDDTTLPPFDQHVSLPSLPHTLQRCEPQPMSAPYLRADPGQREIWQTRLGPRLSLRVGLAWAGNPNYPDDRRRSIQFGALAPILCVPEVVFYSLQIGSGRIPPEARATCGVIDLIDHFTDFADTAALMAELDLIISVDTAVAHLAGALGRPVWTLLQFVPDWRWGLEREDTPWYPTMRLFRQRTMGDWDSVVQRVAGELASLCPHGKTGSTSTASRPS